MSAPKYLCIVLINVASGFAGPVLESDSYKHYVDSFNADDLEVYKQHFPNERAWDFLKPNIPLFDCSDKTIEQIYYFRWWTFRKHVRSTPDGFVITEFLPPVAWAGKYNTISCPAGHHLYEGRWLRDPKYLDDYSVFWFRKGGSPRAYSFWAADAIYQRAIVIGNMSLPIELLDDLIKNYEAWEAEKLTPIGLLWQIDDRDGMEVAIGGTGCRATINSYMYGDAIAIAAIADLANKPKIAVEYRAKAAKLKELIETKLWDSDAKFYKVIRRSEDGVLSDTLADVRELHGYTPWYFNLPDEDKSIAWAQIMDPKGFYAPYGPTTAEQRHPEFAVSYEGHECQWNGPSWPYATSVTLVGLANLLNNYKQDVVDKGDYFDLLKIYTKSHYLKRADGKVVPWIDENLNPFTGDWLARTRLEKVRPTAKNPARRIEHRGKDYNHSTFCDLVITGLVGLRPRTDNVIEVNPLLPEDALTYFALDDVLYHGYKLTIVYDKTGKRYGKGPGLRILVDGKEVAQADTLKRLTASLPSSDPKSQKSNP